MNSLRKVLGFLLAGFILAAFASPGMAQTKIYSLTMSYLGSQTITGPGGTNTTGPTYMAVYKNETPNGNSTINSVILAAPAGMVIANAQLQATYVQVNTNIAGVGTNTISVSNMSGIKAGGNTGYLYVQLSSTATPPPCSAWSPQAFAGNAFSQPFALQTQLSTLIVGQPSPGCQVKLEMSPGTVTENTTPAMFAKFTNPSANAASFSALTLSAPSGLTIQTATLPTGTTGTMTALPGGLVSITNITPAVQPGSALNLSLTVKVAPTCTSSSVNWNATVYAGPALSGTTFGLDPASTLATAISAPTCAVNFTPDPPANGISGKTLPPVTVTLSGFTGSGTVVMTSNCSLTGTTSVSTTTGTATFNSLTITGASTSCTLTATAASYGQTRSSSFTVFATGPIACEPNNTYWTDFSATGATDINQPGYWLSQRGAYNKDGSPCVEIGVTAINSIVGSGTGQRVTFNWDTSAQPGAAFVHTITWNPEYVSATTGMPTLKTKVNWIGSPYLTGEVDARACIAWNPTRVAAAPFPIHYLPLPYGKLGANINSTATSITITDTGVQPPNTDVNVPLIPPVPFAIDIDGERMTVTDTSGAPTWIVARGAGNTTPAPHCAAGNWDGTACAGTAPAFRYVMSNPLPVASDGNQQRVCIAEEGWSIVPAGTANCLVAPAPGAPTVPTSCTLVTTTLYDVGDTTIIRQ